MDADENFRIISKWLEDSEQEEAVQNWKEIYQDAFLCLLEANLPFSQYLYIPNRFNKKLNRANMQLSDLIYQPGIILTQIRYIDHIDNDSVKVTWVTNKEWKIKPKKRSLILECQWTLRPLSISTRTHSSDPKKLHYHYKMIVTVYDKRTGILGGYAVWITTGWDGRLLSQKIYMGDKTGPFPHKIVFPKQIVSRINRCLYSNFCPKLWAGPLCATWHRSDEGVAQYMGSDGDARKDLTEPLEKLINSSYGSAASILLSYACFSMLKSCFPSFHILHNDSPYPEAKKYIPRQIALNKQSEELEWAERLVSMFCGHFQELESSGMTIIDGLLVQKFPAQLKKLSVNEFESKILQPASVLWVNRVPDKTLVESGEILCVQVAAQPEDAVDEQYSAFVVNALADFIFDKTSKARKKYFLENWNKSIPHIKCFMSNVRQITNRQQYYFHADLDILNMENHLSKIRPIEPKFYLVSLKDAILADINEVQNAKHRLPDEYLQLETLKRKIVDCYNRCSKEIRKVQKKHKNAYFSLQIDYDKALTDLKLKLPKGMLASQIVEKAAYLLTSFQLFAQAAIPSEIQRKYLCDRVEASLLSAYQSQLGIRQPKEILEEYILGLIRAGRCARIRGENSDSSSILAWYVPEPETFLLPSKSYFDNLRKSVLMVDINKRDFERRLADAGMICTEERGKQMRRTFEVRVEKGKDERRSVLRIIAGTLSAQFFESTREYLDQIRGDKSPYRSCRP